MTDISVTVQPAPSITVTVQQGAQGISGSTVGAALRVSVANIDDPSPEFAALGDSTWAAGTIRIATQDVAGANAYRIYVLDLASSTAQLAPNRIDRAAGGQWVLVGGKGVAGSFTVETTLAVGTGATVGGTLGVTGAATFASTLSAGAATLASATITGAATVGTTLGVTGAISGSSTITGTQLISTVATGTAPLTVASSTVVPNLNVSQLEGATWEVPGTIGSTTPNTGAFTTLSATGLISGTAGAKFTGANVLVGTTTDNGFGSQLQVQGTAHVTNSGEAFWRVTKTGTGAITGWFTTGGSGGLLGIYDGTNSRFAFQYTAATSAVVLPGTVTATQCSGLTGTITGNAPSLYGSQTWNNAAVLFSAVQLDITDTASNASSEFLRFNLAGTPQLQVTKNGAVTATGTFRRNASLSSDVCFSTYYTSSNLAFFVAADGTLNWGPSTTATDTTLARNGVGLLQIAGGLSITTTLGVTGTSTLGTTNVTGNFSVSSGTNPYVALNDGTGSGYLQVVAGDLDLTPRATKGVTVHGASFIVTPATTINSTLAVTGTTTAVAINASGDIACTNNNITLVRSTAGGAVMSVKNNDTTSSTSVEIDIIGTTTSGASRNAVRIVYQPNLGAGNAAYANQTGKVSALLFEGAATVFNQREGGPLIFSINDVEIMRLRSDGTGLDFASGKVLKVNGTQVVAARDTGWTAMTGSPDKATAYATSTVTLAQLAGRVAQLQAVLTTHGLIGA